jgi:drug/metabolite transporter (DMT)-like permease
MNPSFLAIAGALAFALNNLFARLGMEDSNPQTAVTINVTLNFTGLWIIALFTSSIRPFLSMDLWPFVLAGIFAPLLARTLLFHGYQRLGLARSDVIAASIPLFAVTLAVVILGERPTTWDILGTVAIVLGVALLSYGPERKMTSTRWSILLPLGAALFFALRDISVKFGLGRIPAPVIGAAVAATTAAVVLYIPYLRPRSRKNFILTKRSLILFCFGGVFATLAYASFYLALGASTVTKVTPLISVFPLFSVCFSFLFLQSKEHVTWRVLEGGLLVVGGACLILFN